MEHKMTSRSVIETIVDINSKNIEPSPIGQRPPVQTTGFTKAQGIIESVLLGYSFGLITARDISEDEKNQKMYPGTQLTILDGGNRGRALSDFQSNRFPAPKINGKYLWEGKYYNQLEDEDKQRFDSTVVYIMVYTCTDEEATQIFRRLNTVTEVNEIEMIMANDVSEVAKNIRSRVKSFREYGYNTPHELFDTKNTHDGKTKAVHWNTPINPRRRWDEYIGILIRKAIHKGNVSGRLKHIGELVNEDPHVSKETYKIVDRCLDDALAVITSIGKHRFNADIFGAFQAVWFGLLEKNTQFRIKNPYKFAIEFFDAHQTFTGNTSNALDDEYREFRSGSRDNPKLKKEMVKSFFRGAVTNFSNPAEQQEVADAYLEYMDTSDSVVFLEEKRTVTKNEKFELLSKQKFRCAIDGEPLSIDDAIFGHDTAWAKGGKIADGAIIRNTHNVNMGQLTIEQYRLVLGKERGQA